VLAEKKSMKYVTTKDQLQLIFGNAPNFWLNLQQRNDLWKAMHSPKRIAKIERLKPIRKVTKIANHL
jgi:plasmid maintenance system antidote protein VapI